MSYEFLVSLSATAGVVVMVADFCIAVVMTWVMACVIVAQTWTAYVARMFLTAIVAWHIWRALSLISEPLAHWSTAAVEVTWLAFYVMCMFGRYTIWPSTGLVAKE